MFIFFLAGYCRAVQDIREGYVNQIIQHSEKGKDFPTSAYMRYLVKKYKADCSKKRNRCYSIHRQYKRIVKAYDLSLKAYKRIEDKIIQLNKKIANIDEQIESINSTLEKRRTEWNSANRTGKIPDGCPAKNLRDLAELVRQLTEQCETLNTDRKRFEEEIDSKTRKLDKIKAESIPWTELNIVDLKKKIEVLYSEKIQPIEERYDKIFQFYRKVLIKNNPNENERKIYFGIMCQDFSELCEKCGETILHQENLFCTEQEYINTTIITYFGLKITI